MALNYRFFIDDLEIDEPVGFDNFKVSIVRDETLHGIGFESSINTLQFYGVALDYIDSIKATQGLKAKMVFLAEQDCDSSGEFTTVIQGQLDMTQYKKNCGIECYISLPILTNTCEAILTNRMTQQFDMDSNFAQDALTPLTPYPGLGVTITLPTKELDYISWGTVGPNDEPVVVGPTTDATHKFAVRPVYTNLIDSNFNQTELDNGEIFAIKNFGVLSPNLLWDERTVDFPNPVIINGRLKGSWELVSGVLFFSNVKLIVVRGEFDFTNWNFETDTTRYTVIAETSLWTNGSGDPVGPQTFDFGYTYSWTPIDNGIDGIYAFIWFDGTILVDTGNTISVQFDPETYFKAESTKAVPATKTKAYMLHEALSRASENITDGCVRVKSEYYGRTDSEPFAFDEDGCGGPRMVTSGLKIRNAPPPTDTFFTNFQDLVTGLQAIDNVGMGLEDDLTLPGNMLARIEDIDFFYQDIEIFECLGIDQATFAIEADRDFSIVKIGYKTWQTLANFGNDEFNSDRQYHLNISNLNSTIDLTSVLVAGEYAFEITREQQFVETSSADTTYDNNVFIACLLRSGYQFIVEQGGIENAQNIFNPASVYNYRISPLRNLMRWYRSLIAAYPSLADSANRLYFSSGTGNLQASGQLADGYGYGSAFCKLEGVDIKENMDLFITAFNDVAKYVPLWANETIQFNYPMSVADYNKIKANRYGYITYSCGSGKPSQGWIKDIEWTPNTGSAQITLRQRWAK